MVNMAYNNKFVVTVLINGKPAKETHGNIVEIPYGTNFTLRFRNKHDRRAVVKFSIDGEDASNNGYIIPANSFIDIERFASTPRKFVFVEQNSEAAIDYGKNGEPNSSTGLVLATFYLEMVELANVPYVGPDIPWDHQPPYNPWRRKTYTPYNPIEFWYDNNTYTHNRELLGSTIKYSNSSPNSEPRYTASLNYLGECQSLGLDMDGNDTTHGVTVEGEYSNQKFGSQYIRYSPTGFEVKVYLRGIGHTEQESYKLKRINEINEQIRLLEKEKKSL